LVRLFAAVQDYQRQKIKDNQDHFLHEGQRVVLDKEIDKVDAMQSLEELKDAYDNFSLYYGNDLAEMRKAQKAQESMDDPTQASKLKSVKVAQKDFYTVCCQAGLLGMAEKFGLTPEHFGENLRDNYQRHETEQYPNEPEDVAQDYTCQKFPTVEAVLKAAVYMVAIQLSKEPVVRQTVRQTYSERSKVSVKPTKKGKKEIDEWHECSAFKYLKNKPVKTLRGDQFLRMTQAEQDGLLKISISIDMDTQSNLVYGTYLDEIKQLYYRDEFSLLVEKWNDLRVAALEMALNKFLYPVMEKEIRRKLLQESQDHVIQQCALKLRQYIDVAPYQPEQQLDDDEFDVAKAKTSGIHVLACTYEDDRDVPVWCAMLNGDGQLMDSLRLPNIRIRPNSFRRDAKKLREEDMTSLKEFVLKMRPHVVAVAATNRDALYLMDDIRQCLMQLEQEHQMTSIACELFDCEVARIYQSSRRAKEEFPEHNILLKQAVSLGRCLQDPLLEICGLCNNDNELLCLKLHPLQSLVSQEQLQTELQIQLINEVNDVGVDVNKALELTHHERAVQFVCGLGPRKAAALLRTLRQKRSVLENRSQLVTTCEMGPQVFVNCAAFIKIDSSVFSDSASDYTEVLDASRIHPETYEWARKMAIDALEYDESAEDALKESIEEILESPDKLKDLDLDAFAEELARQNLGRKQTTLYDIRDELFGLYKERRKPYRSLTIEERFRLLTGETADSLQVGKLIMCTVSGIVRKKPTAEMFDNANAIIRNDQTNLYQCPFCMVGMFEDLSTVWSHLDDGSCPGQAIGVRTQLDNGITGFISLKNLSDHSVRNPEERVKEGMSVHCRILRLNMEKFQVDLTSRSQDLADRDGKFGSVVGAVNLDK
jgi:transcription elongation factor SPT6